MTNVEFKIWCHIVTVYIDEHILSIHGSEEEKKSKKTYEENGQESLIIFFIINI